MDNADNRIELALDQFSPEQARQIAMAAGIDGTQAITHDAFKSIFLGWEHVEPDWVWTHASDKCEVHVIADHDMGYAIHVNNCGEAVQATQYRADLAQALAYAVSTAREINNAEDQAQAACACPVMS